MTGKAGASPANLRALVATLTKREFHVRSRRSILGFLGAFVHPALLAGTWLTVFHRAFPSTEGDYPIFVLSGVTLWSFFQHAIVSATNALDRNRAMLVQVSAPSWVFPVSAVLSASVYFAFGVVVTAAVAFVRVGVTPAGIFAYVAAATACVAFTLGVALVVSPICGLISDAHELLSMILPLAVYSAPFFFPLDILGESLRSLFSLNPLGLILAGFRAPLFGPSASWLGPLMSSLSIGIAALLIGAFIYRHLASGLAFREG